MSEIIVFLGPTLPLDEARALCPATFLPPVSQGDVLRVARCGPSAIVLIDGYFNRVPSVWHKEILSALAEGISVFGCSSMGALRAAELFPFGMVGVGRVYEQFRDGILEDDDEVAIIHGPADFGFRPLSEAMVNVRATLKAAIREGVIGTDTGFHLCCSAKRSYYPERTYDRIIAAASESSASARELAVFSQWVTQNKVDQKRLDAVELLTGLASGTLNPACATTPTAVPVEPTALWLELHRLAGAPSRSPDGRPRTLEGNTFSSGLATTGLDPEIAMTCLRERRLGLDEAARHDFTPTPEMLERAVIEFRLRRDLRTREEFHSWLAENDLDMWGFLRLVLDDVRLSWARELIEEEATALLPDFLRIIGTYPHWK